MLFRSFALVGFYQDADPNFSHYSLRKVSIVDYIVEEDNCSKCLRKECRFYYNRRSQCEWVCVESESYACYHSYVFGEFTVDEQKKNCIVKVFENSRSAENALLKAQKKYKQGNKYTFAVHKKKFICSNDLAEMSIEIIGSVFIGMFVLIGLYLVSWRFGWIDYCIRKIRKG